jgi:hypothetical protein
VKDLKKVREENNLYSDYRRALPRISQHKIGYETILLLFLRDKSATCKSPEMKA